jgi:hypothetical protein
MYLKANNRYRLILGGALVITIVLGVLILRCPPALFPDPSWGFQVMRSMQLGGGFNLAISPDQGNIAQNTTGYLTWWSPGQYLLPYFFKSIFGINAGRSAAVTILFCDVLGLWGFYSFFRKVGFSQFQSAISIAFIVSQQFYVTPYIFYNGGETLLFGFLGWFLYGCFSFERINWNVLVFILLSGWVGFFCKSAFLWMYAAGLLCVWVNISKHKNDVVNYLTKGVILVIPAILAVATIYKFYLSKGVNPASESHGFHLSLEALGFPLASPLLSGFSVDELCHGLIFHQGTPIFNPAQTIGVLILLIALSIGLFAAIIRFVPNPKYKLAVSAFYAVSILFFASAFLRQLDISYEARHFRIVGLLFIPGAVYLLSQNWPAFRNVFILLWIGIAFTSIKYIIHSYKYNLNVAAHGAWGISQLFVDQPSLNYLQALDKKHTGSAVFVFLSADLGLEIMKNRIVTIDGVGSDNMKTYVADNTFDGHAGPLFILLPAYYVKDGSMTLVQKCFPGYSNFCTTTLSKNYIVLSAD